MGCRPDGVRTPRRRGGERPAATRGFEALCRQAGWAPDADHGGGRYELHFSSSVYGTRKVLVNWGTSVASFALRSAAEFPPGKLFPEMGYGLLMRNKEAALGSWDMRELSNGNFGFVVSYTALVAGLDGAVLKAVCESLCEEASHVDGGLRSKGLI